VILFHGKTRTDAKVQHIHLYVSILRRLATLSLSIRCNFETASHKKGDLSTSGSAW
jgi:hypothetical protein